MQIKPIHILGVLLFVGTLCVITMALMPVSGSAEAGGSEFRFPSFTTFFSEEDYVEPEFETTEELFEVYEIEVDSLAIKDSLLRIETERRLDLLKIQYPRDDKSSLHEFFEACQEAKDGKKIRVMHYGDSQIEGDRISGYLRNELQKKFGGRGPGYQQAFEVIPTIGITQSSSDNWVRKTVYGRRDTSITHKDYGLLAHFSTYPPDSTAIDSLPDAWLEFEPSKITYSRAKNWKKIVVRYGHNEKPFMLNLIENDSLRENIIVSPTDGMGRLAWNFGETPEKVRLEFKGDAPDIYGISFEGHTGINLDNIPLRGSSGTIFKKISKEQLARQWNPLNVELFLLQFGGNTIPYIEDTLAAKRYGNWFKSQIKYIKSIEPNASIIVIGPSDMSVKDGGKFVTRPFLTDVRDALKKAAFDTGCGFWDIYEVMGGRNSMKTWVESEPALAGKDYTHFTPKGARKMAELFCKTFWEEYEEWEINRP